jgi:hypothetical protein
MIFWNSQPIYGTMLLMATNSDPKPALSHNQELLIAKRAGCDVRAVKRYCSSPTGRRSVVQARIEIEVERLRSDVPQTQSRSHSSGTKA